MPPPPRAWQRMLSGRRLDLLDPTPVDIEIEDIAHGLAFVPRWNGQTKGDWPYSVAEHSLLVERIFTRAGKAPEPRWQLAALLHDAPEYVIGDMISPVKAAVGPDYGALDARLSAAIHIRSVCLPRLPMAIKRRIKSGPDKVSAMAGSHAKSPDFRNQKPDLFFRPPRCGRAARSVAGPDTARPMRGHALSGAPRGIAGAALALHPVPEPLDLVKERVGLGIIFGAELLEFFQKLFFAVRSGLPVFLRPVQSAYPVARPAQKARHPFAAASRIWRPD